MTVHALTGRQREISGNLQLRVEGDRYEVDFELRTTAPTLEEEVPVVVRGSGRGFVVGGVLTGTTEEWMAVATDAETLAGAEPGVELPEGAGMKILSSSQASLDSEGVLQVILQNQPVSGESRYVPSITVLAGRLVPMD